MHWHNFQFCCRYLHQKIIEGDKIETAQEKLIENYPKFQPKRLQHNSIFKSILESNNQEELLSIYGNLNINKNVESITKLTNIKVYLCLVFIVFLIMVLINSTYTIPVFQELFTQMESPIADELTNINYYWLFSSLIILTSTIIVFIFSNLIEQIKTTVKPFKASFFKTLILSQRINNQIESIDALIHSPLDKEINKFSSIENKFYQTIKNDNLNVAVELEILINEANTKLNKTINSRLSLMITAVCVCVVFSIYIFLSSLYTPIFATGTMI